jgi:hypothetical protein
MYIPAAFPFLIVSPALSFFTIIALLLVTAVHSALLLSLPNRSKSFG